MEVEMSGPTVCIDREQEFPRKDGFFQILFLLKCGHNVSIYGHLTIAKSLHGKMNPSPCVAFVLPLASAGLDLRSGTYREETNRDYYYHIRPFIFGSCVFWDLLARHRKGR